jgi:hypothetical protein
VEVEGLEEEFKVGDCAIHSSNIVVGRKHKIKIQISKRNNLNPKTNNPSFKN